MLNPAEPIVVVDDEPQIIQSISFTLKSSKFNNIKTFTDPREGLAFLENNEFSVALLDIMMPQLSGNDILKKVKSFKTNPVVMSTALNDVETAVECIKNGAWDYLIKPVEKARIVTTISKAIEHWEVSRENENFKHGLLDDSLKNPNSFEHIITRSSKLKNIFKYIEAVSKSKLPILVKGESGTGKELFAKAVHYSSGREGEFVAVNVAGLDDQLFSDTLFGHEKGAFTNAIGNRKGLIEKAAGGTLFLDEIGDLSMESQVKLLRLLEDHSYYAIGSDEVKYSDARIVLATNIDFVKNIQEGLFRQDLYYRLCNHFLELPSLKNRKEDLPVLVDFFINEASNELGKPAPTVSRELYALLGTYSFPGNVRELRGMIYDAVSRHESGILSHQSFQEKITGPAPIIQVQESSTEIIFPEQLPTLKEMEFFLIDEAMERSQNNQTIAARMLGMDRTALNKRLKKREQQS